MKEFGKMLIKNAGISAACVVGTFGGLIILSEVISKVEKFKNRKHVDLEESED